MISSFYEKLINIFFSISFTTFIMIQLSNIIKNKSFDIIILIIGFILGYLVYINIENDK